MKYLEYEVETVPIYINKYIYIYNFSNYDVINVEFELFMPFRALALHFCYFSDNVIEFYKITSDHQ